MSLLGAHLGQRYSYREVNGALLSRSEMENRMATVLCISTCLDFQIYAYMILYLRLCIQGGQLSER